MLYVIPITHVSKQRRMLTAQFLLDNGWNLRKANSAVVSHVQGVVKVSSSRMNTPAQAGVLKKTVDCESVNIKFKGCAWGKLSMFWFSVLCGIFPKRQAPCVPGSLKQQFTAASYQKTQEEEKWYAS